jgi:hypothetical protein
MKPAVQKQASEAAEPVHWKFSLPEQVAALLLASEPVGHGAHLRPVSPPAQPLL